MKTLKLTTLLLALALIFGFTSCKYEDGPGISLRSKTARVAGEWIIEKTIDSDGDETTFTADESPVYKFEKDGTMEASWTFLGTTSTTKYTWELTDSKKKISLTDVDDGEVTSDEILRLTNDEMWIKDSDGDKIYFTTK